MTVTGITDITPAGPPQALTVRERQIVALIAQGRSNKEIAGTLFLSVNSVKTYIRSAYRKIGAERRTQAVIWWLSSSEGSAVGQPGTGTR